jgi:Peptidase A4 family
LREVLGVIVRRLVLAAMSAVLSCSGLVLITGTSSAGVPPEGSAIANGPFIPASGQSRADGTGPVPTTTSPNWSGYVQSASVEGTFTGVTDTFVVPSAVSPTAGTQYATDWVGIGGFALTNSAISDSLIQAGVQTKVTTTNGQASVTYDAFTETLPHSERPFKAKVFAGDTVTSTVQEIASNKWRMTVDDVTRHRSRSRTTRYRSTGLSAEVIHERPCILVVNDGCRDTNNLTQLAQTTNITFEPGYFSEAPPGSPPVNQPLLGSVPQAGLIGLTMTDADADLTPIAVASAPNVTNDGFTVADGNVAPSAPNS